MRNYTRSITGLAAILALMPSVALAFDSGSTGADGAFNPTVSTNVPLPASGIFNFSSMNIQSGINVTFQRNTTNTPVVILVSGNVTIAGTLNVSGGSSTNAGAAGDGNLGDDGVPGIGGPGGYDGGRGGAIGANRSGGQGLGPGGGNPGNFSVVGTQCGSNHTYGGAGGGFGAVGAPNPCFSTGGGVSYGSTVLLPLIGGSGGGGGGGGTNFAAGGGGGGAGAILIAASGTVNVTGQILANGGSSGSSTGAGCGDNGGGGSGGGIRIVATTIAGNGTIAAAGGSVGTSCFASGGVGAVGRIRLESESFTRTAATTPPFTTAAPGPVFVAGLPTLAITSVAGVSAPPIPTGNADITLPSTTANPVTVVFTTANVPVGNTVRLTVTPALGISSSVVSPALTGSTTSATTSVNANLPSGPSTLLATTTYTIVASLGDALAPYANGERVEQIMIAAAPGQSNHYVLITTSGKEFDVPAEALAAIFPTNG